MNSGLGFREQEAFLSVKSLGLERDCWVGPCRQASAGLQAVGSLRRAQQDPVTGPAWALPLTSVPRPQLVCWSWALCTRPAAPRHEHGLVSRWHVGVPVL